MDGCREERIEERRFWCLTTAYCLLRANPLDRADDHVPVGFAVADVVVVEVVSGERGAMRELFGGFRGRNGEKRESGWVARSRKSFRALGFGGEFVVRRVLLVNLPPP